ncbi:MAG: hypothetical protein WBE72_04225 [Terracidiphilus sp.]
MTPKVSDEQLNKAALLIAKLLVRTREGKIQWRRDSTIVKAVLGVSRYATKLEDDIEAILIRDDEQLGFVLTGSPMEGIVPPPSQTWEDALKALFSDPNKILSISLNRSYGSGDDLNPENIIYRDLEELVQLAENPKSLSDDLRYQQALTYLDKLSA